MTPCEEKGYKIDPKPLTEQLRSAISKRDKQYAKAKRQAEKLKQREAEVQRLIGVIEREIEQTTGLVCNIKEPEIVGIPEGVDVDDPKTWKAGDVVQCVYIPNCECNWTEGKEYTLKEDVKDVIWVVEDDRGSNENGWDVCSRAKFRFVRRPS